MDIFTKYDYNFIVSLEKNNEKLIKTICKRDPKTFKLLQKVKANVLYFSLKGKVNETERLCKQYKNVIIKAYAFFMKNLYK